MPTTTCLVNNFNYAQYVGEAVDGALSQTMPFDQIVVVDDGSTDDSVELLMRKYGRHPLVQIVSKQNAGQLSSFNEGFSHATGDIVFFLDADDVYEPEYVSKTLKVYDQHAQCDFLFCGRQLFGQKEETLLRYPDDRDLGYSVIRAAHTHSWIGAPTSCMSMRRPLLGKILPLPFTDEWRVRADDCLIFGSSMAGARKRFLAQPLVRYRVHGKNHYFGQSKNPSHVYRRSVAINRLFEHFERTLCLDPVRLAKYSHREFLTIEKPSTGLLATYSRISLGSQAPLHRRLGYIAEMVRHYVRSLRPRAEEASPAAERSVERSVTLPIQIHHREETADVRDTIQFPRQERRAA